MPRDFLKFILSNPFLKGSGLNEHLLIREYFSDIGSDFLLERYVSLGVGDDAAGFKPPEGYEIILSTDTSIEGVHFLSTQSPDDNNPPPFESETTVSAIHNSVEPEPEYS